MVSLPLYFVFFTPSSSILWAAFALLFLTGLGITAGYHRLYSHSTYKLNPVAEFFIAFFGTMATQGSILRWSFDHRHHHAYVDTDKDPYTITKGFWYAHFLWLLEKPKPIEDKVVSDLIKRPLIRFQHKYYGALMILSNTLVSVFFGWLYNDYLGSFLFVWLVRLFLMHHFTWFINSLAHTWGARTFCQELSAVDNFIMALLTFGEGYHNYHHTFSHDYRNGIRWYHYDPSKWLIWSLSKLGLASSLKKSQDYFVERKIVLEHRKLLLDRIRESMNSNKKVWEEKVLLLTDGILDKLQQIKQAKESFSQLRKTNVQETKVLDELLVKMKSIKSALKQDYKLSKTLSKNIKAFFAETALPSRQAADLE